MTLNNIRKMKDERGFTIVELLIVIVVIAILAAIVIVAYTGVTNNARNSKYKQDAASIQKVAETIQADTGSYPTTLSAFQTGSSTTKLPSGVSLTVVAVGVAPASNDNLITAADGTPATYTVRTCTSNGLRVYYPVRGGSTQFIVVGDGTTCGS